MCSVPWMLVSVQWGKRPFGRNLKKEKLGVWGEKIVKPKRKAKTKSIIRKSKKPAQQP